MLYDYRCIKCEHVFEINCRLADIDMCRPCPECKSIETVKCITWPGAMIPHDRLMGGKRIPDGFNDVLQNIATKAIDGHLIKPRIR